MSVNAKNRTYSKETRDKMSNSKLGLTRVHKTKTCEYCGKTIAVFLYSRCTVIIAKINRNTWKFLTPRE